MISCGVFSFLKLLLGNCLKTEFMGTFAHATVAVFVAFSNRTIAQLADMQDSGKADRPQRKMTQEYAEPFTPCGFFGSHF
jgi:hypothetical protein